VFDGMTFCVTGTLSAPRKEIQQRIADAGGKVVGSVSAKLSVLVAGEQAGSKLEKATTLNVTVWTEEALNEALGGNIDEEQMEDETMAAETAPQSSLKDYFG
jgi:DNA ligase (NAD+)